MKRRHRRRVKGVIVQNPLGCLRCPYCGDAVTAADMQEAVFMMGHIHIPCRCKRTGKRWYETAAAIQEEQ